MKSSNLDINFVRKQFPKKCWEWAFFENAGGSFVPNRVINRMTEYMAESQVQPGEHFPMAQLAQERINSGHKLMAALIGAQPDEVIIGASTSMNVYVLAKALRPLWNEGDEVIVSGAPINKEYVMQRSPQLGNGLKIKPLNNLNP